MRPVLFVYVPPDGMVIDGKILAARQLGVNVGNEADEAEGSKSVQGDMRAFQGKEALLARSDEEEADRPAL